MDPPSSSKGKGREMDLEDIADSASSAQSRTFAPDFPISPASTIANVAAASQDYDLRAPQTPAPSFRRPDILPEPASTSSSPSRSLHSIMRTPTRFFSDYPLPPIFSSSSSSTTQSLPSIFPNMTTPIPPVTRLADLSANSSPQSAGQRVIFLRRYIQDTMHKIEYTTNQLKSISRYSIAYEQGFPAFAKLPTEIQLMIWGYAVPNSRKISSSILVIVNHDLNNPKAILPKPKEYKKIYGDIFARTIQAAADEGHEMDLDPSDFRWDMSKHMVFSMMQTCHNSRIAAMKRFCLDVEYPNPKAVRNLPWSEDDTIYFPCPGFSFERRMAIQWLSKNRDVPPPSLATIQHLALPLERILLQAFGITRVFLRRNTGRNQWDNAWLKNMPNLKSFGLYLDPGDVSEKEEGELRLYEAEDVPVFYCSRYTPNEAEKAVKEKLNELKESDRAELDTEASVLCWKKPKWHATKVTTTFSTSPPVGLGPARVSLVIKPSMEESDRLLALLSTETPGSLQHRQLLRQLQEHLAAPIY